MEPKTLEQVQAWFANDQFAMENGAAIDKIGPRHAVCSLTIAARHKNAMGAVMGGVLFTLADFAFAVAANWDTLGTVSLTSNITFLGTAKGKRLIATANCVKHGRTTSYYEIHVADELGNSVAAVTTTGYHIHIEK